MAFRPSRSLAIRTSHVRLAPLAGLGLESLSRVLYNLSGHAMATGGAGRRHVRPPSGAQKAWAAFLGLLAGYLRRRPGHNSNP
jgi:hypothetical protein